MRTRALRSAGGLLTVSATVIGLAACGSSAPKVSSADFIKKCTSDKNLTAAVNKLPGGAGKLDSLCHCVQSKLVSGGFGNRTTDDRGTDIQNASRNAGLACAEQVLAGG